MGEERYEPVAVGAVFYVNRSRKNRHLNPNCRGLQLSRQGLEEQAAYGAYESMDPEEVPTYETRVVRVEVEDAEQAAALEMFTWPCSLCVTGARAIRQHLPFYFEDED